MSMFFSNYTWSFRLTLSVYKISKFGFALKHLPKNMYHIWIYQKMFNSRTESMTMLISTFNLKPSETTKFGFPLKNFAIKLCIVLVLLKLRISYFLLVIMGFLMTECSCTLKMTSKLSKNPTLRFYLKNWPIDMCDVFKCPMV